MAEEVIQQTQSQLESRLEELRPAVEEARRIQAALAALRGSGPRPPVTALDALKPVPSTDGSD
jgi:outer membrane protein TolC